MATYTDSEKRRILDYPIENLLGHFGKKTEHRGQMYYSPFRDEDSPSLHINPSANLWMDFGSGEGGNSLKLVSILAGISLSDAWDYIANLDTNLIVSQKVSSSDSHNSAQSKIVIDRVCDRFTYRNLISYAESRGISRHILERYCRQVVYHLEGSPNKKWTAIGFPNEGGWVLRHGYAGMYAKRCTNSSCTFLNPCGEQTNEPHSDNVEVFEGFFDFMSWLVLKERTKPFSDICILNSVNNLSRAQEFILSHNRISCWLDNDQAGKDTYKKIKNLRSDAVSHITQLENTSCNDLNDLLLHTIAQDKKEYTNLCSNKQKSIKP